MKKLTGMLALVLLLALIAGCGAGGNTSPAAGTSAAPATTKAAADSPAAQSQAPAEPEGIDTSKEVALVMYVLGDVPADLDKVYAEANVVLKEKINATLKTNYLAWSDWRTKYSLTLASGENVDLMYTSDWAYYSTEAAKGAFLELTDDFMNTYMPMTVASQEPASLMQATIGGKLYAIPKNTAGLEGESWVIVRKDLADKYGITSISNIQELEDYYKAVLENEKGLLPFAASADGGFNAQAWRQPNELFYLTNIDWCYQYKGSDAAPAFEELTYCWFRDDAIPYYELMKKWADLGFWSKNAISNTEQVRDAFENGKSASLTWNSTIFLAGRNLRENNAEWDFMAVDVNPGTMRKQALYTNDAIAIASASKNPERAAMFIDYIKNDLDVHLAFVGGIKGVHWDLNADGQRIKGPEADKYPWNPSLWCFNPADGFLPVDADVLPEQKAFEDQQMTLVKTPVAMAFRFDVEPIKSELAAIDALRDEYRPMLQLGMAKDIQATVAEWKQKAEAAGLAKIEAEMKTQYEAWVATL